MKDDTKTADWFWLVFLFNACLVALVMGLVIRAAIYLKVL
jgi:hypothetical protein